MKKIIFLTLLVATFTSQAQPVYVDRIGFTLESIADIDIGWMEIRKHTTPAKRETLWAIEFTVTSKWAHASSL